MSQKQRPSSYQRNALLPGFIALAILIVAIAVLWNPVYPFNFSGIFWILAQPIAGSVFLIAGALIKRPRD